MTPAAIMIRLAGLSEREAAEFLDVRPDTVKSWFRTTSPRHAKEGVIAELRALIALQESTARKHIKALQSFKPQPSEIEIGYPVDDYEAQQLGMPCVGAWRAMAARVVAGLTTPVVFVPRGSTVVTAAAADAHSK